MTESDASTHHELELTTMLLHTINGGRRRVALGHVLCCLLFVVPTTAQAQNLVPNPSFEVNDTCPTTLGFQPTAKPLHWEKWLNSPDYFHVCAGSLQDVDTLASVPQNGWGFQYAWDGEAYVGLCTFHVTDQYREYIGVELLEPMEGGKTYHVSFRANLAWEGSYFEVSGACNNIGLLFTMNSNAWSGLTGPPFPFRNYAHLSNPTIIADTVGWTLVSGSFVADSAYRYLVLGNFFENALTEVLPIPPGGGEVVYYFIDDVCVSRCADGCTNGCDVGIGGPDGPRSPWVVLDPNSGDLLLTWPGRKHFTVEVVDMAGRLVGHGRSETSELRISSLNWSAGVYLAKLRHGEVADVVKFMVVQ